MKTSLQFVQSVSFPRSGFSILAQMLLSYFSNDVQRIPDDFSANIGGDFGYCEFYNHCRVYPCTDQRVTFQKSHDFDMKLAISPSIQHMVLYRNPLDSIISFYEAEIKWGNILPSEDCESFWNLYFRKQLEYYFRFKTKWVNGMQLPNVQIFKYEDMLATPRIFLKQIVGLFQPPTPIDNELIDRIVRHNSVTSRRDPQSFRYYTPDLQMLIDEAEKNWPVTISKEWLKYNGLARLAA